MATVLKSSVDLKAFVQEVRRLANAQFESPQYKRILSLPLNEKRAQVYTLQKAFWNLNRRDCWALAQGVSPMDVKKLIWEHEEDELAGNKTRGVEDHYSLQVRQSKEIHLTLEDFKNEKMREGTRTCVYAYLHMARSTHWLTALASCAALEVSNSSDWVQGGGMSYRMGKRFETDLGIPFHKQLNAAEHAEVDVAHGSLLMQVAERHADTQDKLDLLMTGLIESWDIDRVWKGQLAEMMEAIPLR
ncbi:MAG TPA: iron-containing redox enzyme family protein [Alphaproteobacteria bacterium]|nr:iron-containing redox enzyme family protein [Alphaproteobacteria bacterium]